MTLPKITREEEEAKKKFGWREVWGIREAENMGMVDVDIEDAEWFGLLDRYKGGYYKKGLYTRKQWNKIIESAMIEISVTDELTKKDLMNYMNFKEAEYNEANKKAELLEERDRKIELYKQQVIELEQDNKDYEEEIENKDERIKELEADNKALEADLDYEKCKIDELDSSFMDVDDELTTISNKLEERKDDESGLYLREDKKEDIDLSLIEDCVESAQKTIDRSKVLTYRE